MARVHKVVEIGPQIELVDIKAQLLGIHGVLLAANGILVPVVPGGHGIIEPVVEDMFPL
jgi:hypothetical protein